MFGQGPWAPGNRASAWLAVTSILLGNAIEWGPCEYLPQRAELYEDPRFTDEETEAQSGDVLAQGHRLTSGCYMASVTPRPCCSK